jgi:H-type lectin domain
MSDLTAELNLALCVDDDDTADYLTQTAGLRGSLTTIDGLFSSTTGHNHSGAHQGGSFTSLNLSGGLTVGGNLQVNGTAVVSGATNLQSLDVATTSTLHGAVTMSTTLAVTGATTLTGAATLNGGLTVTNVAASGYVAAGPVLSASAGDLNANRGGTGYVFLGDASHYMGFDGTSYQMVNAALYVSGDRVVTETATETLTNKTVRTPAGDGLVSNTGGAAVRCEYGTSSVSIPIAHAGVDVPVGFSRAFAAPPRVIVGLASSSGASDDNDRFAATENYNVTASGFQWRAFNGTGTAATVTMNWIAIGS